METTNDSMIIKPQLTRAAGLDIHKNRIVVCYYIAGERQEIREYETFTEDLEKIRDDMLSFGIKDALMESTGVYWIALSSILLSAGIRARVVNARAVKSLPKEKTDRKDATWLCKILVNGTVKHSYIAGDEQRTFRELCRQRAKYGQHLIQTRNRIAKLLERRNIKIRSVMSNLHTKTAHDIINALADGETDLDKLVLLCRGKLKKKKEQMRKALNGVLKPDDRFLLKRLQMDITHFDNQVCEIEKQITQHTDKVSDDLIKNLKEVSGVGKQSVEVILSEIGDNVNPFASADHLAAWTGLAPGNYQTADKVKAISTREGNKHLRNALVSVAWGAVRTKDSYWRALFAHLHKKMHHNKAIVVVARKLLKVIYKIMKGVYTYKEFGAELFIQHLQDRLQQKRNHNILLKPVS
jgi:transposase